MASAPWGGLISRRSSPGTPFLSHKPGILVCIHIFRISNLNRRIWAWHRKAVHRRILHVTQLYIYLWAISIRNFYPTYQIFWIHIGKGKINLFSCWPCKCKGSFYISRYTNRILSRNCIFKRRIHVCFCVQRIITDYPLHRNGMFRIINHNLALRFLRRICRTDGRNRIDSHCRFRSRYQPIFHLYRRITACPDYLPGCAVYRIYRCCQLHISSLINRCTCLIQRNTADRCCQIQIQSWM